MGLLIYSCNEKISPALQNGSSATVPGGVGIAPKEYFFKVTNTSPVLLNYVLHRTGPGNAAKDCTISSQTPLSSTLYRGNNTAPHDSKFYDISCFFETEELSLYLNGLDFKVEASQNTCDYVGYAPYSYYDSIPGASNGSFAGIKCDELTTNAGAQSVTPATFTGVDDIGDPTISPPRAPSAPRRLNCGEMVDMSIVGATNRRIMPIPDDAQSMCIYDYSYAEKNNKQNCDSGLFFITSYPVTTTTTTPPKLGKLSDLKHSCGGALKNCVAGPIKLINILASASRGTEINYPELNKSFEKEYKVPKLIGTRVDNFDIVNYRRGVAALNLPFSTYASGVEWADPINAKLFNPNVMEFYAANQTPDGNPIINTSSTSTAPSLVSNAIYDYENRKAGFSAPAFAADPFLGFGARVNPFYTFYCFDKAMEIKARIRMVVRDWDRTFPSARDELELISDVYKGANAMQDLPNSEEENPGDPGMYNLFNDINDWDVHTPMQRSGTGDYVSTSVFWSPLDPLGLSPTGFWRPSIFPNQAPLEN